MLIESSISGLTRLLQLTQLLVIPVQRLREGFDQVVDGLLTRDKVTLGLLVQSLKRRPGETEERFVVLLQRLSREGLKRFGQFATRLGEQQLLFFHMFDGFGDLRLSDGTGSRRFGEIAAKSLKLRTVYNP